MAIKNRIESKVKSLKKSKNFHCVTKFISSNIIKKWTNQNPMSESLSATFAT